jgi:acetyl esterase/lipase
MREAGVPVRMWRILGQIHGFLALSESLPEAREIKVSIAGLVGAAINGDGGSLGTSILPPLGALEL